MSFEEGVKFTEEAVSAWKKDLITIIRSESIVRKLYDQNQAVTAAKGNYIYHKILEQSNVQHGFELQRRKYNVYASKKMEVPIPIHQGDLHFLRHEVVRAAGDKLPVDRRVMETLQSMIEKEEIKGIYGDPDTGTILHDTTNVSTSADTELDLTTFATGRTTLHTMVSQLRALLKNKFAACKLKVVWTSNVDDRSNVCASALNDLMTFRMLLEDYLVKFNKGGKASDYIFTTNYLGSATGVGSANMALLATHPQNMELITSEVEVTQGLDNLNNLDIQLDFRSKPIFYRLNDTVIYSGTVDITG